MTLTRTSTILDEGELLAAARAGDEDAFRRLVEPYRGVLHAHCYRMLGSVHDAEDALQDALFRAWRALRRFEGRSALRTWLYRIATNACLEAIGRRPKRVLPIDYGPPSMPSDGPGEPLAESVWVEPYPDEQVGLDGGYEAPAARYEQRGAVELAFVAALQHLPARQRAVLILREVLGFSAREVAQSLDTTVASVNSALQRARRTVDERLPQQSQQVTLRALGDKRTREILQGYVDAWERRDVDAIVAMLTEDATLAMPPHRSWWRGRDAIGGFMKQALPLCPEARHVATWANGQPAIAWYLWDAEKQSHVATAIEVVTLDGARVKDMTSFVMSGSFPRFGLPDELPSSPGDRTTAWTNRLSS